MIKVVVGHSDRAKRGQLHIEGDVLRDIVAQALGAEKREVQIKFAKHGSNDIGVFPIEIEIFAPINSERFRDLEDLLSRISADIREKFPGVKPVDGEEKTVRVSLILEDSLFRTFSPKSFG